jgi:hypothetical protein
MEQHQENKASASARRPGSTYLFAPGFLQRPRLGLSLETLRLPAVFLGPSKGKYRLPV